MRTPLEIFGQDLLNALGPGPRQPYYHTPGRKPPLPEECTDYGFMCYRGTENKKPNRPLQIDTTIEQFLADQSILDDLKNIEDERKIFVVERKYLWIINEAYELRILPEITQNPDTARGIVCHTNITAGGQARHGGELWYGKDNIIFLNNSSGRFYTLDSDEWAAIIRVFITAGYTKVVDIDLKKNTEPVIHE